MNKLWGGRFASPTHEVVERFSTSIAIDQRLWRQDVCGSVAHARMLGSTGIIPATDSACIIDALQTIYGDIENGTLSIDPNAEDIHSFIEAKLYERIGPVAGKLHTGRSRNDQVATDTRLYLMDVIPLLQKRIQSIQQWLLEMSERNQEHILPGLTHMQHGQPVSLAHHLLAYFWMLERDKERLSDCLKRTKTLPLGSAALAGTALPINRLQVAEELGFENISENSLDAVSDRDFVVEFLSASSLIMMHLSRWAEELVLWCTPEFGFVKMADSVTTGSSLMPQKKNPDVAELIRGRSSRLPAALTGVLGLLKGLPLSYNRDLQEDKSYLFDGVDTVNHCLEAMLVLLQNSAFQTTRMAESVRGDFSNATDIADALVRKGMPFREAHGLTGQIVADSIAEGKALEDLSLQQMQLYSSLLDAEDLRSIAPHEVMSKRNSSGGTGKKAVTEQWLQAKDKMCEVAHSEA